MKIRHAASLLALLLAGTAAVPSQAQMQAPAAAPTPAEMRAKQAELDKTYPQLTVSDDYMHLSIPGYTMGQTMGVATNSKGHLFVYSRSNPQGIARGGAAAMLWEFDQNGKYVKEWGPHNYAASFAHAVRVDAHDNVYQVDEGSGMIVRYDPKGQQNFWLGRTPEAIDYLEANLEVLKYAHPTQVQNRRPVGRKGEFDRETDIGFDSEGNMFVPDGYGNSRVVKISPDGHWLKMLGTFGSGQDQFNTPHTIAVDARNNVYVGDRGNFRIQVYDNNLNYQRTITGIGAPWALCISEGPTQYMFSGDGNGRLYKMDMSGKVLGMAVTGQDHGAADTGDLIHSLDCRNPNVVYIGSASMFDVQKVTIK